jgi:hypothetical protein
MTDETDEQRYERLHTLYGNLAIMGAPRDADQRQRALEQLRRVGLELDEVATRLGEHGTLAFTATLGLWDLFR